MSQYPKKPILLVRDDLDLDVFNGLVSECDSLGWRMINLIHSEDYIPEGQAIVGAILSTGPPPKIVDMLRERNIPIVNMAPSFHDISYSDAVVREDRAAAGRCAADAFGERGFVNMGYLAFEGWGEGDSLSVSFKERAETEYGATVHAHLMKANYERMSDEAQYHARLRGIAEWLQEMPKPLGVLAYNSRMSIRVIIASELAGLLVPEQVAVVCRGNNETECVAAPVPLSAIDMNLEEQARRAVQIVKKLSEGGAPPNGPILTPIKGLVERRSTDILAIADARVAKAIRFMWDHLEWPIGVDDVADEVGVKRSTLEKAFRASLGWGINAELRRKRLEYCKDLLRTTSLPLSDILKAVGWSSRRYLHGAFKDAFGMTPNDYRKLHGKNIDE